MQELAENLERRTTTDVVFEQLYREIASLELLPGAKLSEVEVAKRFSVSRQPVRDAFSRLVNLELLVVRPQKATQVRGFSLERIAHARFVRRAIELEVVHLACKVWDSSKAKTLQKTLDEQHDIIKDGQFKKFHQLDNLFHRQICELGGCPNAIDVIDECRQKIDRLCELSLGREAQATVLLEDHTKLAEALKNKLPEDATAIARLHLSRLDDTIADIHQTHSDYFEQ